VEAGSAFESVAVRYSKPHLGAALPSLACDAPWFQSTAPDALSIRGQAVVVHFFSSDCPLCDDGARHVARWIAEFGAIGLVVVGAFQPRRDVASTSADAMTECERYWRIAPHPCVADAAGELSKRFGNEWWPAYFVYDAAHRLRHYQMGNDGMQRLDSIVRECALSAVPRESPD
jgi:thiol-disulfide isomerase/thioredoxin